MVVGEALLITLTTEILRYISQDKQRESLYIHSPQLRHRQENHHKSVYSPYDALIRKISLLFILWNVTKYLCCKFKGYQSERKSFCSNLTGFTLPWRHILKTLPSSVNLWFQSRWRALRCRGHLAVENHHLRENCSKGAKKGTIRSPTML